MRGFLVLMLAVWAACAGAQDWEDRRTFGEAQAPQRLRVLSSTDTEIFAPVLAGFVATRPDVSVEYFVAATSEIDRHVRNRPGSFDVVISSAMDLQFKLANDGFAAEQDGIAHPDWGQWRRSLFAFTSEPAAIVVNRKSFPDGGAPRTRQGLIRVLRERPEAFRGRVGTYDVRQSGLGYLFATQDARTSETFWRLMEVMGNLEPRLYCCSGAMIEDVAAGRISVAYNVLASYADARKDLAEDIEVILPDDFRTVMMRTAFVSSHAQEPALAGRFLRFLLDSAGLRTSGNAPALPLLDPGQPRDSQSTIELEPALLTYLDRLKTQRFLAEWADAVIQ